MENRPVVLVFCEPLTGLDRLFSTAVLQSQEGQLPLGLLYLAAELERSGFTAVSKTIRLSRSPKKFWHRK